MIYTILAFILITTITYTLNINKLEDGEKYVFKREEIAILFLSLLYFTYVGIALYNVTYGKIIILLGIISSPLIVYDYKNHMLPLFSSLSFAILGIMLITILNGNLLKTLGFVIIGIIILLVVSLIIPIGFADIYSLVIIGLLMYYMNHYFLIYWIMIISLLTIICGYVKIKKTKEKKYNYHYNSYRINTDNGVEWCVEYPEINGVVGGGKTEEEAILAAKDNLKVYFDYLEEKEKELTPIKKKNKISVNMAMLPIYFLSVPMTLLIIKIIEVI